MGYPFMTTEHRAVCVNVVDGHEWDLLVDRGFYDYKLTRFKLSGYDAYELLQDTPKIKTEDAKKLATYWLKPLGVHNVFDISNWPLRIRTHRDPDNSSQWFADLWFQNGDGKEIHIGDALVRAGVAVKLLKKQ